MDHVLTDQAVPGHSEPGTSASHATGSALDVRASALLDPAKVLLHGIGEHDMRRRGSDIARVRPVVLPDGVEAVELATLGRRQTVDDPSPAPSLKDIESAAGSSRVSVQIAAARDDEASVASSVPFVSSAERKRQKRKTYLCFATMCWMFFLFGWNDSSTGPLLPTIQRYYNVGNKPPAF